MFFRKSAERLPAGNFSPEPFQIVTVAHLRKHQMNDHRAEIEQNPAAGRLPVLGKGADFAEIAQLAFDEAGQRPELRLRIRRGDHEPVSDRRLRSNMNFQNIFGQLLLGKFSSEFRKFGGGRFFCIGHNVFSPFSSWYR